MDFRRYAEDVIRSEVPAHILPKICWISQTDMAVVEKNYHDWLKLLHGRTTANRNQTIKNFLAILSSAKNIYPNERLSDCGTDENASKFVLSRTAIGSFQQPLVAPGSADVTDDDVTD